MSPRLSIIVPNYNYGHYLQRAISSVAESLYDSFEIILIDDGSTDNSLEIAEKLAQKYPQIRLYKNEKNQGLFKTVERGVELAQGSYLHFLASDDYRLPGFCEESMQLFDQFPEIPIVCSDFAHVSENNETKIRIDSLLPIIHSAQVFNVSNVRKIFRYSDFWVPGHTSIIRKDIYLKYGGLQEKLSLFSDWVLLHQIALFEGIIYLPKALGVMRLHDFSFSAKKMKGKEAFVSLLHFFEEKKALGKIFRETCLLRNMTDHLKRYLFFRPKYWKYLFPNAVRSFEWHFHKYFGICLHKKPLAKVIEQSMKNN